MRARQEPLAQAELDYVEAIRKVGAALEALQRGDGSGAELRRRLGAAEQEAARAAARVGALRRGAG